MFSNNSNLNYTLTRTGTTGGTVTGSEGSIAYGTACSVTATPLDGYVFKGWYENDSLISSDTNYKFNMPARNVKLVAKFGSNKNIEIVTFSSQYTNDYCTKGKDFGYSVSIQQPLSTITLYIPGNGPEISTASTMGNFNVSIYYSSTFDGNYTLVGSATTTVTGPSKYTVTPYKVSSGAGYYKFSVPSGSAVTVSSPGEEFRITSNCR